MRRSAAAVRTIPNGGGRRRPTSKEMRDISRLLEERSMHALYRLDRNAIVTLWRSVLDEKVLPCVMRSSQAAEFLADLGRGSMVEEECRLIGDGGFDGATMLFEDTD